MNILNKLTIKHLKMNKKRTIVTIIGIILSTALMVGIGLLFSSLRDNTVKTTILNNGPQHLTIDNVESKYYNTIKNNVEVKNVSYTNNLGFASIDSSNEYKPYVYVVEASKDLLDNLILVKGRFPENENEIVISKHIKENGSVVYNIGDEVTFDIGKRVVNIDGIETEIEGTSEYNEGEYLINKSSKTYKIVGIVERTYLEPYSSPGYFVYSKSNKIRDNSNLNILLEFKNPKKAYEIGEKLGKMANIESSNQLSYNDGLLYTYGTSRYSNIVTSMNTIIIIILSLISIACIIVIYNSFAISVMERKKQFGLFSSIGATKKQIRKTVFFEAFIVGIIGIPLGILSSLLGIGIVLKIVNILLPNIFDVPLALTIYPTFILIPVLFMVIVILVSAFLPARRASKITPIEAIRQNDDIKIKNKKLKTPKFIRKIFKEEGVIAYKNIKRNKKKYRITIASLFISIVLFVSFSSILDYAIKASTDITSLPEFDRQIMIRYNKDNIKDVEKIFNTVKEYEGIDKISLLEKNTLVGKGVDTLYTTDSMEILKENSDSLNNNFNITLIKMDNESYNKLKEKYNVKDNENIVINKTKKTEYDLEAKTRKTKKVSILKEDTKSLDVYDIVDENKKLVTIDNLHFIEDIPMGLEYDATAYNIQIIVSSDKYDSLLEDKIEYTADIVIKGKENKKLDKYLKDIEDDNGFKYFSYMNLIEDMRTTKNMITVMQILLYGFISLVTLIGVTSVFNTINTSIALRRKEFAMLRSIGLTPKGFNRILYFESLFFGLKSLIYGIPVAIIVTFILGSSLNNVVTIEFLFPIKSIIIAIIGVFIIVFLSMMYASRRIKKENILEALREENI